MDEFCARNIYSVYETVHRNDLLPRLNNQGRQPEQVFFSWVRGYATAAFFGPALEKIFNVTQIESIGDDDFSNPETFARTPKADLQLTLPESNESLRIEVQSGFQSISDIKLHKVREAKKVWEEKGMPTWVVHFNLFDGQVAFVRIDNVSDTDARWIIRPQMEGQTVFAIDYNCFVWKLTERPPSFSDVRTWLDC